MDVDGAVAKEAPQTGLSRNVQVRVLSCEWAYGDVAMLAGEISNLACLWVGTVTRRDLATYIRIKMCRCSGTIPVGWNRLIVNMVKKWAEGVGEPSKEDIEEDTSAIRIRGGRNVAMYAARAGKGGIVGLTLRVVLGYGSIPQFPRIGCPWNLSTDKSEPRKSSEGNSGVHLQRKKC